MAEEERILEVTPDFDGKRIDQCLAASFSDCSRSFLQKLLKDGKVSINGKTQKASSKVAAGDAVLVLLPEPEELNVEPENIPLDILYEDDDLLVVNKPKGMVVHPAAGHSSGTLVNAVLYHCRGNLSGINGVLRPGIVHRIDMDTTGALVICTFHYPKVPGNCPWESERGRGNRARCNRPPSDRPEKDGD